MSQSVSQSSQPPRTIEQKGLESRGTSALAQAIGTGAPVPVDAAQRDAEITPSGFIVPPSKYIRDVPQQQPTPPAMVQGDGPWIIEQVGDECLLHNPTLSVAEVRTFKVSRNGITWLRDILNKQHAESKRLREALEAMVAMAAPNVYPQPGFTPGPWEAQNDGNYNLVVINNGQDVLADCGLYNTHIEKRTQREANARLIAAAPNLYAYAKAEELKWKWSACFFPSPEWDVCKQNFDACLRSMGWDETTVGCMTFLKDYRAAALAKAGGR